MEDLQVLAILSITYLLYLYITTSKTCLMIGNLGINIYASRIICFIIPVAFACLNGNSADRLNYIQIIQDVSIYGFAHSGKEYAFLILVKLLMSILKNADWTLFVVSLISNIFFYIAISRIGRHYSYNLLWIAFVASIYFWGYVEVNSYLSISIGMLAISYLIEDNKKKFLILCLIGCLFHYSLIALLLVLFFKKNGNLKNLVILLLIITGFFAIGYVLPIVIAYIPFLHKYAYYLSDANSVVYSSSLNGYVLYFLPLLIYAMYIFYVSLKRGNDDSNDCFIAFGTIILFVCSFFITSTLFYRLEHIYYTFFILIIARIGKEKSTIFQYGIGAYCLVLMYSFFYFGNVQVLPYSTFLK